jgi:hypothetical protein
MLSLVNTFGRANISYDTVKQAWTQYSSAFLTLARNEGLKNAVANSKGMYQVALKLATGEPFHPIPFRKTVKGTNIPRTLQPLIPLLTGDKWSKRIGLTLAGVHLLVVLPPDLNVNSITDSGKPVPSQLLEEFKTFLEKKIPKQPTPKARVDLTFGARSGPNGPAVPSAHLDARALLNAGPELLEAVKKLLTLTGHPILSSFRNCLLHAPKGSYDLGRLAFLPENGGKTRIIAIVDFWTQQALKPFHEQLLGVISQIDADCTLNQNEGFKRALRLSKGKPIHSFDLTSATDRFPLSFQMVLMNHLYGPEISGLWETVISKRMWRVGKQDRFISWGRGQPLGAYSSWVVFSYAHHLLVQFCAWRVREDPMQYSLLGDDLMIWNDAVAKEYEKLIGELDVPISQSKSLSSAATRSTGEFTKRIFTGGVELSPIPLPALLTGLGSILQTPNLLRLLEERWGIPSSPVGLYASEFLSLGKKNNKKKQKGMALLAILMGAGAVIGGSLCHPWCAINEDLSTLQAGLRKDVFVASLPKLTQKKPNLLDLLKGRELVVPHSLLTVSEWSEEDPHPIVLAQQTYTSLLAEKYLPQAREHKELGYGTEQRTLKRALSNLKFTPDPTLSWMIEENRSKTRRAQLGKILIESFYKLVERRKAASISQP